MANNGYNPERHHRRSIRLLGYNYANAGSYFVTVCLNRRIPKIWRYNSQLDWNFKFPTFGIIENEMMILNDAGKMVQQAWHEMREHYSNIEINEFIVMPDHTHGIITITDPNNVGVGAAHRGCPYPNTPSHSPPRSKGSLPQLVHYLKTRTTNKYADGVKIQNWQRFDKRLWQRNYYESIIRNDTKYAIIAQYIRNNPILWQKEHMNAILR